MVVFPQAKINIGLHVTAKRPDGFHDIETLFYQVTWCDVLEVLPSNVFSFQLAGLPVEGDTNNNLCVKAYKLLKEDFELPPIVIYLYKNIPTGAGLGGGSSDATAMLQALNELFSLSLSMQQLHNYAVQLGSDCAFFLHKQPMLANGRGEQLTAMPSINLSGYSIAVIKPPVSVNTAEAYAGIIPQKPIKPLYKLLEQHCISTWKYAITNDFELSIFKKYPVLAQIKQQLYDAGAVYAAMSGSGSALFGLFADKQKANQTVRQICSTINGSKFYIQM